MALASAAVRRPAIDVERIAGTAALVALLDGVFAVVFYVPLLHRTTALRLFQGIAASLLGRTAAFDGGIATGVMGVLMHVGVALGWTVVFALAYSRSEGLRRLLATMPGAIVTGMSRVLHLADDGIRHRAADEDSTGTHRVDRHIHRHACVARRGHRTADRAPHPSRVGRSAVVALSERGAARSATCCPSPSRRLRARPCRRPPAR